MKWKSAVTVRGLRVTKGAKAAIEAAGGSVEGIISKMAKQPGYQSRSTNSGTW